MTPRHELGYTIALLRAMAEERDNPADPETRSLRYAAGQLEHFTTGSERESMPRGRNGAGIALRNNGNEGFASVSESADGDVAVEVGIDPVHIGRLTITVNEEKIPLLTLRKKEDA